MSNVDVTRDAPRAPLAPVDPNIQLPESVRRAAQVAESYYAQQPAAPAEPAAPAGEGTINIVEAPRSAVQATPAPVQPQDTPVEPPAPAQAATPAEPPAPTPAPPQAPPAEPEVTEGQWEHRYRSMKGRHDALLQVQGAMQEQMQQMGDELLRTQQLLMGQQPNRQPNQPPQPTKLITPEDEQNYGNDLIDLARRAGREAVAGELDEVKQQNARLAKQVQQDAQTRVMATLDQQVPNWREINRDPRFIQWLRLPDIYSGVVRKQMLDEAFRGAHAPRVLAFFKGFISDEALTGNIEPAPLTEQPPPAPRTPAVPLERLAAPGRARPAGGDTPTSALDKPIFTRKQIADFYSNVRQGRYAGRDADKARDEAAIFAAQNEGRVR